MTPDGPMVGDTLRASAEQFLAPVFRPGDIVMIDNLPSYKSLRHSWNHSCAGALLAYLPPYSADLNPIEQVLKP